MKTLTRTCLLLAAVAGLFVCGANLFHLKQKIIRFRTDLKAETASRKEAETALLEAQSNYIELSERLKQTQDELDVVVEERQTAVSAANTLKVRLVQSAAESANVTRERDEALQELSRYRFAGLEPKEIAKAALYIRELESSLTKLQTENQALHRRIAAFQMVSIPPGGPPLPPDLKAQVVAYDPKWRFLVLDIGESQGVVPQAELLVAREGKLVAKVKVARVEENRCIANHLPNWKLSEV